MQATAYRGYGWGRTPPWCSRVGRPDGWAGWTSPRFRSAAGRCATGCWLPSRCRAAGAGRPGAADLPGEVRVTREDPPGGGPVAATAAGLALLHPDTMLVALLAADLPLLTRAAIGDSATNLAASRHRRGVLRRRGRAPAVAVRGVAGGRAAGRAGPAGGRAGRQLAGAPVRGLLAGLVVGEVPWSGDGPPPWFDCDTDEDVRRAEEWAR